MRAALVDPTAPGHLAIQDCAEPRVLSNQALVSVKAISLNLGEVKRARRSLAGTLLGWDVAGVIEQQAEDGSGPPAGTRVVGVINPGGGGAGDLNAGGWAELAAVNTEWMSPLPPDVSFADAATLPVAGLTALYALEQAGQLLGRNVLVTGASGGVGVFGIQLAKLSGATVTALVRSPEKADVARDAGADNVVVGDTADDATTHGPYYCILDSVGGEVLSSALRQVSRGGILISYGISAGEQATIDAGDFFRHGRTRYYGLYLFTEFGRRLPRIGLRILANLLKDGRLKTHIDATGGLDDLGNLAERLFNREVSGKAVITLD